MTAQTNEETKPKQARESQGKADEKLAAAADSYLEELEKYHIAGQGYMEAPKPPAPERAEEEQEAPKLTIGDKGSIIQRSAFTDRDRWKGAPGRIAPEEAVQLRAQEDEEAPKSAAGYYYAVAENGDDDDDEGEESTGKEPREGKERKPGTQQPPPPTTRPSEPPRSTPPSGGRRGE